MSVDYTEVIDALLQLTMKNNWKEVVRIYKINPFARWARLTKTRETALHIAVSNYHADRTDANQHAEIVCQLVESLPGDEAFQILQQENDKGDTPLHLASALGSVLICQCIALKYRQLIRSRNRMGETPLFLAAHHGKMEVFLLLHKLFNEYPSEPDYSLCRRKDGDTFLHSAISREYFELACQIITYYPRLVSSENEGGFHPLHILARMPNVFLSRSDLGLWDGIIYRCVNVHTIEKQKFDPRPYSGSPSGNGGINCPDNYQTCVNFIRLPWAALRRIASLGKDSSARKQSGCRFDIENPEKKDENQGKELKDEEQSIPNYATGFKFFKFAITCLLVIFGIGNRRISRIRKMKETHIWAVEIMNKLIKQESIFKYSDDGRKPTQTIESGLLLPYDIDTPLSSVSNVLGSNSNDKEEKDGIKQWRSNHFDAETRVVKRETPLLLAAKMGIIEMVHKILEIFPLAIEDLDADGKNALLLAVEYRQTEVYVLLVKIKLPESVFYQLDSEGNSVMHLAAKFPAYQTWIVRGGALQMLWEIRWCEHVKQTIPPQCLITYNMKGETANEIFTRTHERLVEGEREWLMITSESCTVVAVLIASVAYATSSTVPGGLDQNTGYPLLENQPLFHVYSVTSVLALCFSVAALVFFLAILTSRFQQQDFRNNLPQKLLFGLICLSTSIRAMLISFCTGHFFVLKHQFPKQALPTYIIACFPVICFVMAKLPLYFEWMWSMIARAPLHSYRVYYN